MPTVRILLIEGPLISLENTEGSAVQVERRRWFATLRDSASGMVLVATWEAAAYAEAAMVAAVRAAYDAWVAQRHAGEGAEVTWT